MGFLRPGIASVFHEAHQARTQAQGVEPFALLQGATSARRRIDVESDEEWVKVVLDGIDGRNLEGSVGAWLSSELKRRGWARWRAAEALGVRLPRLTSWLSDSAEPTETERERITSLFGPGLPRPAS